MNKATHVEILGVQIPLHTLASVTSTSISPMEAAVNDLMEKTLYREMVDWLKAPSVFDQIAERSSSRLPMHTGVNRQFFSYENGIGMV